MSTYINPSRQGDKVMLHWHNGSNDEHFHKSPMQFLLLSFELDVPVSFWEMLNPDTERFLVQYLIGLWSSGWECS